MSWMVVAYFFLDMIAREGLAEAWNSFGSDVHQSLSVSLLCVLFHSLTLVG